MDMRAKWLYLFNNTYSLDAMPATLQQESSLEDVVFHS